MEGCSQLSENDIGYFEGKCEFGIGLQIPIERYRFDSSKERLRGVFDQLLVSFLREKYGQKSIRPIPALCGGGQPVDLFKLFWVVRKIGGYDAVNVNSLWGFVLEECGLFRGLVPSVKLIYRQYLDQFDQWLGQGCDEGKSLVEKLDLFYQDLKAKYDFVNNHVESDMERVSSSSDCVLPPSPFAKKVSENIGDICCDDNDFDARAKNAVKEEATSEENEPGHEQSDDHPGNFCDKKIILAKEVIEVNEEAVKSRKRKRGSQPWMGMLDWLKNAAKNSDDSSIGKLPEISKWSSCGSNESWMQALLVRKSLLVRRNTNADEVEQTPKFLDYAVFNKKAQMNPSMYEDGFPHHKILRSSRISSTKSHMCSCCCSSTLREETSAESIRKSVEPESWPVDVPPKKAVSVGPQFQAEIPEPPISESDPKWLGQKLWPQENGNNRTLSHTLSPIGEGRQRSPCDCPFPNSVECVRFHIAEKKLGLKLELGSVFYRWGFDRMGEEVSLSWTAEEEKRFKDIVRSSRAFSKEFWDEVSLFLPNKMRQRVVRYYFDVYLVQRRSYQNRVTPKDIDSDDDERECGSIGEGFGYRAVSNPGSRLVSPCEVNTQATEFS